MLVPRQLTVDRGSIAFHHSRPHGWRSSSFSTPRRAISCYPDSKSLVPLPPPSHAIDIASIESDVEGALSGSSRRPEYPAATFSLSHLFSSTSSGNSRDDTDERKSVERRYQTKFRAARFSCLTIDSESLIRS